MFAIKPFVCALTFAVVAAGIYAGCDQVSRVSEPENHKGAVNKVTPLPQPGVLTTTTFGKCVAGWVRHDPGVQCDDCDAGNFTSSTSGAILVALGHPQTCESFKQGPIMFDTSSLDDNTTITSAKLKFNVKTYETNNIYQPRLRIYADNTNPCPSALDGKHFYPCSQTLVNLGTIDITSTGNYEFTIPSPDSRIDKANTTVFLIVDASVPDLYASLWDTAFEIRPSAVGSAWAPTLEVVN